MGVLDDLNEVDWVLNQMVEEAARLLIDTVPVLKQYTMDILWDLIFVPRIVAKQMALALLLESGRFVISQWYHRIFQGVFIHLVSSRARMLRQLTQDQQEATTQDQYMLLAEQMDAITGDQEWRMDPDCPLYERDRITTTIDHYLHLMRRREVFDLLYLLRGNLGRNQFGLLNKSLFSKAQAGTKVLVETYHNVVCAALEFVCDANAGEDANAGTDSDDPNHIPTEARLAFFNEVRHAYGRSSLLLSGGAALGYYHVGVVKALMENNLMPRVIGGASAGSIVCAMIGTRTDEECINDLFHLRGTMAPGHSGIIKLEFFRPLVKTKTTTTTTTTTTEEDSTTTTTTRQSMLQSVYHNTAGAFQDTKRTWQLVFTPRQLQQFGSTLYDLLTGNTRASDLLKKDTEHFKNVVKANCGNFTFQEAFDRTGRICNIIVSPKNQSDPPRLLNYLTAPHVLVWSAAVASASVPGIFEANCLMVKDPDGTERYESSTMTADGLKKQSCANNSASGGVHFQDGSFETDLPMQQLSEMFNVNHFIISQVNPQAVLFGSYNHRSNVWSNPIKGFIDSLLRFLKHQCRCWLLNGMKFLGSRRFRPLYAQTRANIGTQLLTQEYEGRECDISLIPWRNDQSILGACLHMLYNPTPQDFFDWTAAAERETWKYIPRIKCHIAEEIALDQCVQRLRNRLILESRHNNKRLQLRGDNNKSTIGNGLPSFFVSPSLTNLTTTTTTTDPMTTTTSLYQVPLKKQSDNSIHNVNNHNHNFDMNSGWAGMGLRGNRSSGSLDRQVFSSHDSGLFIDDADEFVEAGNPQQPPLNDQHQHHHHHHHHHHNGEAAAAAVLGNTTPTRRQSRSTGSLRSKERSNSYCEPGSMGAFYYRRASNNSLQALTTAGLPASDQQQQQQQQHGALS